MGCSERQFSAFANDFIDRYVEAWADQYEQACEARVAGGLAAVSSFDRRVQCLRRHQGVLQTTIDALAQVSTPSQALGHTVLPFKLPAVEQCADPRDDERRQNEARRRERLPILTAA